MTRHRAFCSSCNLETNHEELYSVDLGVEDAADVYTLLKCAGCETICLEINSYDRGAPYEGNVRYYPPPVARREPEWLLLVANEDGEEGKLGRLLCEIYQAVHGGQLRLAAMGIRALLEQMMITKVGDHGTFLKNLDAFQAGGWVSLVQRDAISIVLDAGHAVTHRLFQPSTDDLNTALDIIDGVFAAIYVNQRQVERLAERTPSRRARKPPPP